MKKLVVIALFLFGLYPAFSQEKPYWFTDISRATEYAKTHHTPVLMIFAGSDWCRPCIQFERSILSSEKFSNYASENIAILYLDFPRKKSNQLPQPVKIHHERLAERFNKSGAFPTLLLLDANEKLLGTLSYQNQSIDEFIKNCEALRN